MYPSCAASSSKTLTLVSFKCWRVDIFYVPADAGLVLRCGDNVIVEADRGHDLGTVQHINVTYEQARLYKRKYAEEQYKWLMMSTKNRTGNEAKPNKVSYAKVPAELPYLPQDNCDIPVLKGIKRLASPLEVQSLAKKQGNEVKAKRTCQQRVAQSHLDMDIVEAEWQW